MVAVIGWDVHGTVQGRHPHPPVPLGGGKACRVNSSPPNSHTSAVHAVHPPAAGGSLASYPGLQSRYEASGSLERERYAVQILLLRVSFLVWCGPGNEDISVSFPGWAGGRISFPDHG